MRKLCLILLGCLVSFAALAQTTRTATINFTKPITYTDGTPIPANAAVTYRVYQGARGGQKTLIGTITETQTEVSSGLERGQEYCFQVTTVVGNEESDPSNEGCKAFRVPTTVTITVT